MFICGTQTFAQTKDCTYFNTEQIQLKSTSASTDTQLGARGTAMLLEEDKEGKSRSQGGGEEEEYERRSEGL